MLGLILGVIGAVVLVGGLCVAEIISTKRNPIHPIAQDFFDESDDFINRAAVSGYTKEI